MTKNDLINDAFDNGLNDDNKSETFFICQKGPFTCVLVSMSYYFSFQLQYI